MDESVKARDQAPKSTNGKQELRSIECQLKLGDAFTHMLGFELASYLCFHFTGSHSLP